MYYQRYLSLFVLGDFSGVVRDTSRNLRVLDMCGKYAVAEQDRVLLEQYRPYIIMMRTRASASMLVKEQKPHEALDAIRHGLANMKAFFEKFDQAGAFARCEEAKVLKRFGREIKRKLPVSPAERLERRLKRAIAAERYGRGRPNTRRDRRAGSLSRYAGGGLGRGPNVNCLRQVWTRL